MSMANYGVPEGDETVKEKTIAEKKTLSGEEVSASRAAKTLAPDRGENQSVAEQVPPPVAEPAAPDAETPHSGGGGTPLKEESAPKSRDRAASASQELPKTMNQSLLDSALEYYEASDDFWEQGDLDNAIDALDKAYSLILRVNQDESPEIQQQKEDLRVTISKRIIEVYASRFTAVNGYHKAIPLVMNNQVQEALSLLKGREKNFFLAAYRRSGRYRPAIVEALKKEGLPEELSWLPLIESGFKVRAFSSARALGLWQFVASTGYKFGLKRGPWIDERMDPEKSTQAAIAYLKELHEIFGDWTTVLAAYNCGELRVLNLIREQRINYLDNFWDLYEKLPRETAFYVPKFLAVLHILNDPSAYGITLPEVDEPVEVDEVTISKQVQLKTVAERLEMSYELLRDLNPELRRNLTPMTPYPLNVPKEKAENLTAKLKDIPVWQQPVPSHIVHRVKRGETLSVIASRYKTSVGAIMSMNGLKKMNQIRAGSTIKIPAREGDTLRGYSPTSQPSRSEEGGVEYVVKQGDSLWKIAKQYGITTQAIISLNRLRQPRLQIGQVLLIPGDSRTSEPGKIAKYTIRKGDSPYLIARKYRMDFAEFLKINNLTRRSTIFPGQTVLVKED